MISIKNIYDTNSVNQIVYKAKEVSINTRYQSCPEIGHAICPAAMRNHEWTPEIRTHDSRPREGLEIHGWCRGTSLISNHRPLRLTA